MLQRKFLFILLTFISLVSSGQYKEKMLIEQSPGFGQYELKIIPMGFDSTVSDSSIMNCIDTLPAYLFGVDTYNLMYKDDSTKLAIMINKHGMFRRKFYITEYWKNGNIKREAIYKLHSKHYLCSNYYMNEILSSKGKYRKGKKIGKWIYVNTGKKKIRVEHYAKDGTLKKAKNLKPPKYTFATFFNVSRPSGRPYVVR